MQKVIAVAKKMSASLKERISKALRDDIIFGRLMPGERIKEAWLSEKFKCSRGPVRETLIQLEREGFLELIPNQGAIVSKISPKEVEDFYALLELLEGKAVRWATPLLKPEDINSLKQLNNRIREISTKSKNCIEEWIPLNLAFHRFFREKCGNDKLNWIIEEIRIRITRFRYTSLLVDSFDEYVKDHDEIIALVHKGNAVEAEKAMQRHIRHAKKILMRFLSRFPA